MDVVISITTIEEGDEGSYYPSSRQYKLDVESVKLNEFVAALWSLPGVVEVATPKEWEQSPLNTSTQHNRRWEEGDHHTPKGVTSDQTT